LPDVNNAQELSRERLRRGVDRGNDREQTETKENRQSHD